MRATTRLHFHRFHLSILLIVIVLLLGAVSVSAHSALPAPLAASLPASTCSLAGSTRTCDLWAKTGTISLPGAASVAIRGYADTELGAATSPGPVLIANEVETLQIVVHNQLAEASSLEIPALDVASDVVGAAAGQTITYTFPALRPGTYLYEAGPTSGGQRQALLGMFGALIVRPTADPSSAYGTAASAFSDEALLIFHEIDPAFNANPSGFSLQNYAPRYWLINGQVYTNTAPIDVVAGNRVLLRYINAGSQQHAIGVLGLHQTVLSTDAISLTYSYSVVAETLAAGQTADAIITMPAVTGIKYPLYDTSQRLHNAGRRSGGRLTYGGMLTFLNVPAGVPGGDTVGPIAQNLVASPATSSGSVNVVLTGAIDDSTKGNSPIAAAEYFIDAPGANGAGTALSATDGTFNTVTENITATLNTTLLATLSSGDHTLYVHGQDAAGNWGTFSAVVFRLDKAGPATTGILLTPNVSQGNVDVSVQATGNDTANGNSNVNAAEYFIDASGANGAGTALTLNQVAPIASLNGTLSAGTLTGLSEGAHTLYIHSQDAFGNWGAFASAPIRIDRTGPLVPTLTVAPSPNNGTLGFNPTTQAVRVDATLSDPVVSTVNANLSAAEGFIDTVGAPGTGFPLTPLDGLYNSPTENAYALIPLTTINTLSTGTHTITVRGKDAAGNWGAPSSASLVIDRAAPTVGIPTLIPPASNNTAVAISATATDVATGNSNIGGGEYFIDTVGAAGTGTAMSPSAAAPNTTITANIPAATIAALTTGNHTVYVRAKDVAGNWSTPSGGATLLIDRTPPTFSGITLTPISIAVGTATVNLTVNGSSDGAGGSGVAGGEYWICQLTCTNPATGSGTAFSGLTASISTGLLAPGHQYTVRTRIRDVAGNWSTGANGVRSAMLTVTTANNIFTNGFESGNFSAWSSTSTGSTTRLNVTAAATLFGAFGMQAQGNNTNYVQYNFTPSAGIYDARFYFRPNGNSSTGKDIFSAATSSGFGTTLFRVRYRLNGSTPQVQIQVGTGNANTTWTNINGGTANNVIEVVWQAVGSGGPNPGTLQLYVNGALAQTLTTTSTSSVAAVRLGSVTSTGNNTLMYFDAFASKRSASPLIGP